MRKTTCFESGASDGPPWERQLTERMRADCAARGIDFGRFAAVLALALTQRGAILAVGESRDALAELRKRAGQRDRARVALERASERFGSAHVEAHYARPYREACDRLARAQRRLLRAERELDTWSAELLATVRELGPLAWGRERPQCAAPCAWLAGRAQALREESAR